MNITDLQKEISYRWRVQSFSKYKPQATCVAYIDARDAMKILDEVVGPENWQDDYKEVNGMLFGGLAIRINKEWIWKWDTGSESNIEKEKGHVSDSFKRAAVKWGIGRFLYDLDVKYVSANEKNTGNNYPYVVDEMGNRVWDLTKFINGEVKTPPKKTQKTPPPPHKAKQTEQIPNPHAEKKRTDFVNYAKKVFSDQLPTPMDERLEKLLLKADKTSHDERALLKWFLFYLDENDKTKMNERLLGWSRGRGYAGFSLLDIDTATEKDVAYAYKSAKKDFKAWVEQLDGVAEPPVEVGE